MSVGYNVTVLLAARRACVCLRLHSCAAVVCVCRAQDWYLSAVNATPGTSVWSVGGDLVPVITYATAIYNETIPSSPKLLGVVAADMVVAQFVASITGFLANVSPNGEVHFSSGCVLVVSYSYRLSCVDFHRDLVRESSVGVRWDPSFCPRKRFSAVLVPKDGTTKPRERECPLSEPFLHEM